MRPDSLPCAKLCNRSNICYVNSSSLLRYWMGSSYGSRFSYGRMAGAMQSMRRSGLFNGNMFFQAGALCTHGTMLANSLALFLPSFSQRPTVDGGSPDGRLKQWMGITHVAWTLLALLRFLLISQARAYSTVFIIGIYSNPRPSTCTPVLWKICA